MSKISHTVYPAVALLSLAAAFSAHAQQGAFDPVDQAGYGATVVNTASNRTRAEVRAEAIVAGSVPSVDRLARSGYGATLANTASTRTRAEVQAEAIAARQAGYDLQYLEGGDIAYAALNRAKAVNTVHVTAAVSAPSAGQ